MKTSDGIKVFRFSIEKVLKNYGKWFLKMCENPEYFSKPKSGSLKFVHRKSNKLCRKFLSNLSEPVATASTVANGNGLRTDCNCS